jgi:hypothetical protein
MKALLAGVAGFLLVGCTTVQFGRDFEVARFDSSVRVGVTDQSAVRGLLGAPVSTGISMEGGERLVEWTYYYGDGKLSKLSEAKFKLLQVRFDAAGKVKSFNWSE